MILVFAKTAQNASDYIQRHGLNSKPDGSDRAIVLWNLNSVRGVRNVEVRLVDDWRLHPAADVLESELRVRARVGHLTYSEVEF